MNHFYESEFDFIFSFALPYSTKPDVLLSNGTRKMMSQSLSNLFTATLESSSGKFDNNYDVILCHDVSDVKNMPVAFLKI